MKAAFVYDDVLSQHVLREDHVMVPTRLRLTYELLEAYGAFRRPDSLLVKPRMATGEELLTFHTKEYVEAVKSFSKGETRFDPARFNFSETGDNPIFQGMFEASAWAVGASLVAAELVASGQTPVAFNCSGGLHHAAPGNASGFCVFNDAVIAIKHLLSLGMRVAYVDIDCHHGDGVQYAFDDTDQVLTISLHESGRYLFPATGFVYEMGSGSGMGYAVNVPLYPQTDDETYLMAFREVVPPLVRKFQPDVLVTQLGVDTHFLDPITDLKLTAQGHAQVVRELRELSPGRWLALGGGGYDLGAVARCWALDYGVMLGVDWPDDIPASYEAEYGLKRLRDEEAPTVETAVRREAQRFAQRTVEDVKRYVFPIHGL